MLFPIICLLLSWYLPNKLHASLIAAGSLTLANVPFLITSFVIAKRSEENTGSITRALLFTFHARSNVAELLLVILLTPCYAFLLTYKMNWAMFYMAIVSSYSMTGEPIPEITPYLTNQDFHLLSY